MDKVQHFEIPADNLERAKKFYSDVFGWNTMSVPEMEYVMMHTAKTDETGMIQEKGVINGGMMKKNNNIKSPVITISVMDIDKAVKDIQKHGGKLFVEKMEIPKMGFTAYFKDSEGNIMGLFQSTRKM